MGSTTVDANDAAIESYPENRVRAIQPPAWAVQPLAAARKPRQWRYNHRLLPEILYAMVLLGWTHVGCRPSLGKYNQKFWHIDRSTVAAGDAVERDVAPSEDPGTPKKSILDIVRYCNNDNSGA
ncbi:hypothetical protein BHM03_00047374 [Ensete ventricosum]|nr:hypothetical protein BHM03_00047374 [Ensete ventricosum]